MLCIDRRPDQDFVLDFSQASDADIARLRAGELIVILTVGIKGDKAKQGITAPPSVIVDRREVYEDRMREARAARAARKAGAA